jgi:hypothetical protein
MLGQLSLVRVCGFEMATDQDDIIDSADIFLQLQTTLIEMESDFSCVSLSKKKQPENGSAKGDAN